MANIKQILIFSLFSISLLSLILLLLYSPPTLHRHFFRASNLANPFPPLPKIAYFISGTGNDGPRITRLLLATYHPRNYYLLHLDHRASKEQRDQLASTVRSVEAFVAADNVRVIEKANWVNGEGSTPLALVLHGAAILLRCDKDWDWFVNLDASDYPLLPQDDFLHILSFVPRDFNFIEHTSNTSWKEYQRIMEIVVDPGLYLMSKGRMFMATKRRKPPNAYRFFTGSSHVILSRKLVEFFILGWDNLPRTLLLFFSNTKLSHRGYFQTLACNSKEFSNTVVNSNLRFVEWDEPRLKEPRNLGLSDLKKMMWSGAAFAGKFPPNDPVLDMIDLHVLHRSKNMISPGGWCLGKLEWDRDSCQQWGDPNILRPGPAAKKFEKLLMRLMVNTTFQSNICNRR
uniref:Putative xylosyltransferase-like isoform X1 n=1 Tax=Davidia involucrata TaxID=16924 RepID=A0A5B7B493_DAVIN